MNLAQVRRFALTLPEVTEAPHHDYGSFRVRGKIFVTLPPDEQYIHVFVDELKREQALVLAPDAVEKLFWGGKAVGLRIALARATPALVNDLVRKAWARKAPKSLVAALAPTTSAKPSSVRPRGKA